MTAAPRRTRLQFLACRRSSGCAASSEGRTPSRDRTNGAAPEAPSARSGRAGRRRPGPRRSQRSAPRRPRRASRAPRRSHARSPPARQELSRRTAGAEDVVQPAASGRRPARRAAARACRPAAARPARAGRPAARGAAAGCGCRWPARATAGSRRTTASTARPDGGRAASAAGHQPAEQQRDADQRAGVRLPLGLVAVEQGVVGLPRRGRRPASRPAGARRAARAPSPWPTNGGVRWAASPASSTRPARHRSATCARNVYSTARTHLDVRPRRTARAAPASRSGAVSSAGRLPRAQPELPAVAARRSPA